MTLEIRAVGPEAAGTVRDVVRTAFEARPLEVLATMADVDYQDLDPYGATRLIHWTFTFEKGIGIVFREDGRGCRLAYLGQDEYSKAHDEADTDWS